MSMAFDLDQNQLTQDYRIKNRGQHTMFVNGLTDRISKLSLEEDDLRALLALPATH
jgi:hypothetical protein